MTIFKKLSKEPAKPLGNYITVKRSATKIVKPTVAELKKMTQEQRDEAQNKDYEVEYFTEIYDIGSVDPKSLPFKVGDKVVTVSYGTEVVTAEDSEDIYDISYAIINPNQVVGVYEDKKCAIV
jgi:formylmethanofuran dehydrogenase subunit D